MLRQGDRESITCWVVKDYSDSFDFNKICVSLADPRVFRWKIFNAIVGIYNDNEKIITNSQTGYDVGGGLGSIPEEMTQVFCEYRNWYLKENPSAFNKNKNLMIFNNLLFIHLNKNI